MKRSKFSEEKIIGILKEVEAGAKVGEVCRRHGISEQTLYRWRAKFGGMDVNEASGMVPSPETPRKHGSVWPG